MSKINNLDRAKGNRTRMIPAQISDSGQLYKILLDAAEWLRSKGVQQWDPVYPRQRFYHEIEQGKVFYIEENEQVLATVTISDMEPDYYPPGIWDNVARAWYIARLAVSRDAVNQSLGADLLKLIEDNARNDRIEALRLDVIKLNPFLTEYYERTGFSQIAEADIRGTPSIFMEKRLQS